jgi:hypothetical protein
MITVKLDEVIYSKNGDSLIRVFKPTDSNITKSFYVLEYKDPKSQRRLEEIQCELENGTVIMDENYNEFEAFSALDILQLELAVIIK